MHADVWYTKQRVDGNRFQRKNNNELVVCSWIVSVNISEHGQLEARALMVDTATAVSRISFLRLDMAVRWVGCVRFGIATQRD